MDDPVKRRFGMPPKKDDGESKFMAEHTVESGETLSGIALKYYKSAAKEKYMAIYDANKKTIGDDPNLIKPGMVLKIPELS